MRRPVQVGEEEEEEERQEDLLDVIERMRAVPERDLTVAVEAGSRLAESRFNFQLLRRYADQLGKRLTVRTTDSQLQRLAAENGLGVEDPSMGMPTPVPAPAPAPALERGAAAGAVLAESRRPQRDRTRGLRYVSALAVLVAGLGALAIYIPTASVTLVAEAQPFSVQYDIAAQPQRPPIRVRTALLGKQSSASFKATGVKSTPGTFATTTIVYSNQCQFDLAVPNGQRLRGPGGIQFAQLGDLQVDRGKSGSAPITATEAGARSNLAAGQITIIENNPEACLTGTNPSPASGGADEKKEPQISQNDWDAARVKLEQDLRQQVAAELGRQAQPSEKLLDNVTFESPDFAADHRVGELVTGFSGSMTVKGEGTFYMVDDVTQALTDRLQQDVIVKRPDDVLLAGSVKTDYRVSAATAGGQLSFQGTARGFLAPRLDYDLIKRELAGRSPAQAQHYLQTLPVRSVELTERPLELPLLPLISSRIDLRYVVEQGVQKTG